MDKGAWWATVHKVSKELDMAGAIYLACNHIQGTVRESGLSSLSAGLNKVSLMKL